MALVAGGAFFILGGREGAWAWWPDSQRLGLVRISGPIVEATEILSALEELEDDERVLAIVVRIDSPGGAVGASQEIYRAIQLIKKPVVASLGNVAASGGYYIASACNVITAAPGTLTGSIGVITTIPNLEELLAKLGVRVEVLTSAPLKGTGQSTRALRPEEKVLLESIAQDLHRQFVADVARGRNMAEKDIAVLADGRVYTGRQALENKLIDKLGNYRDALDQAVQMGGFSAGKPEIFCPQDEGAGFWNSLSSQAAQTLFRQITSLFYSFSQPAFILPPLSQPSR
ncbi:MAG: signal peptide peptidase SppA [Desulfarculales bacterium]|jgi:protease-4|nr:signal peptide peptidase SppA [Desulfarculales bacterium]